LRASCRRCGCGRHSGPRRRLPRRARGAAELHAPASRVTRSCAARCYAPVRPPHPASARRSRPSWADAGFRRRAYWATRPWPHRPRNHPWPGRKNAPGLRRRVMPHAARERA
jgi:hypothetical protein